MRVAAHWLAAFGIALLGFAARAQDARAKERDTAVAAFESALSKGPLVGPGSAYELLGKLQAQVDPEDYAYERGRLVEAMVRIADLVITHYTTGDEVPPTLADYRNCAQLYEAANHLSAEARSEARMYFCRGRSELDPKTFDKAEADFKNAIRIAPLDGGYAYNSLGIVYLEEGLIGDAMKQFDEAKNHESDSWTYPHHNRALAYIADGNYRAAVNEYRKTIQNAESANSDQLTGSLHYNLGVLYYQLGQKPEAECEYETALKLFQDQEKLERRRNGLERAEAFRHNAAEAYNALGASLKSRGRRREAEEAYRTSLELNDKLSAARNNLRLLLGKAADQARPYTHIPLPLRCVAQP